MKFSRIVPVLAIALVLSLSLGQSGVSASSQRSVTVSFYNSSGYSLSRVSDSTNGTWGITPPVSISSSDSPDDNPHRWRSDGPSGGGGDASGSVTYQINVTGSPQFTLSWKSVDGQSNSYSYTAPSGYTITDSGTDGITATVTYTLTVVGNLRQRRI